MSSWFENQEQHQEAQAMEEESMKTVKIRFEGQSDFIEVNKNQVSRIYSDDLGGALMILIDEVAELLTPTNVKTEAGKEEDNLKQECVALIQSITQLGRSAGIHMLLATQRNDTKIIPGVVQNNPLSLDQRIIVKRKIQTS